MTIRKMTKAIPLPSTTNEENAPKQLGLKVNTRHLHHHPGRIGSPRPSLLQRRALEMNELPMLDDIHLNVSSDMDEIVIMQSNSKERGTTATIRHKRCKSLTNLYSPTIHIHPKRQSVEVEDVSVMETSPLCGLRPVPVSPSVGHKRSVKQRENRVKVSKRCKIKHKKVKKQKNDAMERALKRFHEEESLVDASLRSFTLTIGGINPIQVDIGVAASQGTRSYMEDCFSVTTQLFGESEEWTNPISLLAIYDGHSGHLAAEYASQRMQSLLAANPFLQSLGRRPHQALLCQDDVDHIERILCETFATLDEEVLEMTISRNKRDGTTVLLGLLVAGKLFVANLGDSRGVYACMDGNDSVQRISVDHKPNLPDETTRIEEAGGKVIFSGCWRVAHDEIPLRLAVSRSFGDHPLKANLPATCTGPLVSVVPDIKVIDICSHSDREDLIVFATDGLWDRLSDDDAMEMARASLDGVDRCGTRNIMQSAANTLIVAALTKRSMDNITVMVIRCSRQIVL